MLALAFLSSINIPLSATLHIPLPVLFLSHSFSAVLTVLCLNFEYEIQTPVVLEEQRAPPKKETDLQLPVRPCSHQLFKMKKELEQLVKCGAWLRVESERSGGFYSL